MPCLAVCHCHRQCLSDFVLILKLFKFYIALRILGGVHSKVECTHQNSFDFIQYCFSIILTTLFYPIADLQYVNHTLLLLQSVQKLTQLDLMFVLLITFQL